MRWLLLVDINRVKNVAIVRKSDVNSALVGRGLHAETIEELDQSGEEFVKVQTAQLVSVAV